MRDDGAIVPPGGDVTESDSMVSITRREETDDVFDDTESSITSVSQAAAGKDDATELKRMSRRPHDLLAC